MIELRDGEADVRFAVKAQPGGRKTGVVGEHDGALKVMVAAAPEKGKANKALIAVLAEALNVRKRDVRLINGETSSEKTFSVQGLDRPELARRLALVLDGAFVSRAKDEVHE